MKQAVNQKYLAQRPVVKSPSLIKLPTKDCRTEMHRTTTFHDHNVKIHPLRRVNSQAFSIRPPDLFFCRSVAEITAGYIHAIDPA